MIVKFHLTFIQPTSFIRYHIKRILAPYSYYVNRICHKAFSVQRIHFFSARRRYWSGGPMLSADRGGLLARDVAQGPGDLGFATTGAKRRTRTLEEPSWALLSQKERAIHRITLSLCENKKSARRDSNPRPRPWQGRAPPTEPLAHFLCCRSPQRQVILYMIYLHLSITFFKKF